MIHSECTPATSEMSTEISKIRWQKMPAECIKYELRKEL